MTEIINDNVQITMTIGGDDWLLAEAEVELSLMSSPNYVDINVMVPAQGTTFDTVDDLIGQEFILEADNELISERDAEEDSLLFKGALANISATGEKSYEGIAYDPSQQPFADPDLGDEEDSSGDNGSILNQTVRVTSPWYGILFHYGGIGEGTQYEPRTIEAKSLANKIIRKIPTVSLEDADIQLQDDGKTVTGPSGSFTGAFNEDLTFDTVRPTIDAALEKIRVECDAEWWFDKEGIFHLGVPDSTAHELRYITSASDGVVTPPYQSVRVIGSGIASEEGDVRTNMRAEDRIVVERSMVTIRGESGIEAKTLDDGPLEPVFRYRNSEISTQSQADNVANRLISDLAEQQAQGKVTVTGFPEIIPLDCIVMPHANPDSDAPNFQSGMPMGGKKYGVYKVVHRLNGSDGFKTIIHVAGLVGATRVVAPPEPDPESTTESESESGEGPGVGVSSSADLAARIN